MSTYQVVPVLDFARRAAMGEFVGPVDFVRALLGLALDFVDIEDLKQALTEEAQERAERIADLAEWSKLSRTEP